MISTPELGRKFKEGATRGISSRTSIVEGKDKTYLVDYGWAILGERDKKTGKMTYYSGWYGYSPTTSKHISQTGIRMAEKTIEGRKQLSDVI